MKLFKKSIELVVIRDVMNPQGATETYRGHDLELLLQQAFGRQGLPKSVKLYHGAMLNDITPETEADVDRLMRLNGRIYAVVKPQGIGAAIAYLVVSTLVTVALSLLTPKIPEVGKTSTPPSPNNALAARTNNQRYGGRIPDIFGTVWSVPDLIAPTYSVYLDNREVEFSYMCIGRGRYDVTEALDDTTPINQVFGSGVMIFDPDTTLDDEPSFVFGSTFNPDEAEWSRLAVTRYTSVNGQVMPPSDNYINLDEAVFRAGGIIEQSGVNFSSQFTVGNTLTVVQSNPAESANGITEPPEGGDVVTYNLSGIYTISTLSETRITLSSPESINSDWQKLIENADFTVPTEATVSTQRAAQWQGWFYTANKEHDLVFINIRAPNGLYITGKNDFEPIGLEFEIESEIVDSNNNPIAGTLETETQIIYGSKYHEYAINGGVGVPRINGFIVADIADGNHWWSGANTTDDEAAQSAASTFLISNSNFEAGKRLRFRVRRKHGRIDIGAEFNAVQEIRIADFYSARQITAADNPSGVTTVYTKSLGTEGALSLKERKLRLLVQRYVSDAISGLPVLSNRADDILRHVLTDLKIGNLSLSQVDFEQIKTEVDLIIERFGTPLCAEFCYTFDDTNTSSEEIIQTIAKAVFSQAKREGNLIKLDFERSVPASVAVFNSHNILPDTYASSERFGINRDYDGVTVEYISPDDDATVTLSYPTDGVINPHEEKLVGVRNKVQAHMHMMRLYNKDQFAYKTCEFTAGDESNIVVRTNRVTVADQLRADVQQGSVAGIETIGGDIVLTTLDPVALTDGVAHTLFIQTINNGVEAIEVSPRDDYSVILSRLPSGEISSGYDVAVIATYQIVASTDLDRDSYLVTQKDPAEAMTNKLTCTNYDDRYYQNDSDFINDLIED